MCFPISLVGNSDSHISDGECKHYTAPRKLCHFAHALFSRVWLKIESQTQCEVNRIPLKIVGPSRAPCLILIRHGLIFHLFHFLNASPLYFNHLTVTNNHQIHALQGGLVDWLFQVRLQIPRHFTLSPTLCQIYSSHGVGHEREDGNLCCVERAKAHWCVREVAVGKAHSCSTSQ